MGEGDIGMLRRGGVGVGGEVGGTGASTVTLASGLASTLRIQRERNVTRPQLATKTIKSYITI